MTTKPRRPTGLGPRGARLWKTVTAAHELDAGETELLVEAARTLDLIDQLREALDASELTVPGSTGQSRPNPLLSSLLGAQENLRRLVGALDLPEVVAERPPNRLEEMRVQRRERQREPSLRACCLG